MNGKENENQNPNQYPIYPDDDGADRIILDQNFAGQFQPVPAEHGAFAGRLGGGEGGLRARPRVSCQWRAVAIDAGGDDLRLVFQLAQNVPRGVGVVETQRCRAHPGDPGIIFSKFYYLQAERVGECLFQALLRLLARRDIERAR